MKIQRLAFPLFLTLSLIPTLVNAQQLCHFEADQVQFERKPWNSNLRAHTNAWGVIGVSLKQFRARFSKSGDILLKDFSSIKSSEHKDIAIFELAETIDDLITGPLVKAAPQVADTKLYLRRALSQGDKTLNWLADLLDCLYEYRKPQASSSTNTSP